MTPQAVPPAQHFQLGITAPLSHWHLILLLYDIYKPGLSNIVLRVVEDLEALPNFLGSIKEILRPLGHEMILCDRSIVRREHD
jgi:hypothetical protein